MFTDTVNTDMQDHVFVTPLRDCEGLYVASQSPTGFEVRDLPGGKPNVAVDYRIVAPRKRYENRRLDNACGLGNITVVGNRSRSNSRAKQPKCVCSG